MNLIKKHIFIFFCLATICQTYAQNKHNIDTIRRELTVENEKYITVNKETPMSFNVSIDKPKTQDIIADFDFFSEREPISKISFVDTIPSFVSPKMISNKNIGYVDVFGGLAYNLGITAGVNIINKNCHKLAFDFSSLWTNHSFLQNQLTNKINEIQYNPNIRYDYKSQNLSLYAAFDFLGGYRNYYGLYSPTDTYTQMPKLSPQRDFNHSTLSFGIDNLKKSDKKFTYGINSRLLLSNSRYSKYNFEDNNALASAILFGDAILRYSFNNDHSLNIYADAKHTLYLGRNISLPFYLNAAPTYRYNSATTNISWLLDLGLGLTLDAKHISEGKGNLYIWPKINAKLSFYDRFVVNCEVDGGGEIFDLYQLERIMPYYSLENKYLITRNLLRSKIDLLLLCTENFKFSLFYGFYIKDDMLQFRPKVINLDNNIGNIAFTAYGNRYNKYEFGGAFSYRPMRDLSLSSSFSYNIFSKYNYQVTLEPKCKGMLSVEYKPTDKWLAKISYNFAGGIKYTDINQSDKYNSLPLFQSLSANVSYLILKNLTLYTTIQTTLSKNTSYIYPYYSKQGNILLLGANFHF